MTEQEFHRLIEGHTDLEIGTNIGEEAFSQPVVDFVHRILHGAANDGADRIYFEHSPSDFAVSFIVNDQRYEMARRPPLLGALVLTCLKSIARDGRIRTHRTEFELSFSHEATTETISLQRPSKPMA